MESKKFVLDQSFERMCSACGAEQSHNVQTVTKQGQITKLICSVCATVSTFKNGVKSSVSLSSAKAGTPYDSARTYRKGQMMAHSTFGAGEVTAVIEPQKIDVLFGDRTRRLIHARA